MEYSVTSLSKNTAVLKLKDNITVYQLENLKDAIGELKKLKGCKNVIVDASGIGYLDAFALGIISSYSRELRDNGGDLKFISLNEDLKRIFKMSQLVKVYEIYDNIEEAEESFHKSG